MTEDREPPNESPDEPRDRDQPDDAPAPVPNRRERRGGKSGTPAAHGGKSAPAPRSGPPAPSRQYSTRRRSG